LSTSQSPLGPNRSNAPGNTKRHYTQRDLAMGHIVMALFFGLIAVALGWVSLTTNHDLLWPGVLAMFFSVVIGLNSIITSERKEARVLGDKREAIEKLSQEQSTPKLAWDLARITLEQYFNRNLLQTQLMFYLALVVMFAGFGLVVWTIMYATRHSQPLSESSLVGVGAGVITQFIGATFMVLYRSTIQQASNYVEILERINAVGMAVQIIEDVPKDDPLHNKTRAEIASLLLRGSLKLSEERPIRSGSKKTRIPKEA
jgi:hypothetical protein